MEPVHPDQHAQELWAAAHGHDAIWDYLGYGPFATVEGMHAYLRGYAGLADPIFFAIRDGRDGKVAGIASLMSIRPAEGVIEIGHIWFAPSLQHTREATEALYLLMRHAMDDLGYRRLEWKCNALNAGSRAAAARLGFAFEGIFYQATIVKGCNRDTAWFSILDGEWQVIRAHFEDWLALANFDDAGRQVRSLGEMNRALRANEG
jgi:RimJ/RimL family protein N-acetyltransferase